MGISKRMPGVLTALLLLLTGGLLAPVSAQAAPTVVDAAATDDEPDDGGLEDGLALDAESYAKDFGVTTEEARARLTAQNDYGRLVEEIEAAYPDTFAGSTLDHEGDFGLRVRFTGDKVPERAAEIAEGAPAVTLEAGARYSIAEAEKIIESTGTTLDTHGTVEGVYYDSANEKFVLDMVGAATSVRSEEAVTAALRATLPASLPEEIRSADIQLTPQSAADGQRGGLPMTSCTSGFSVKNSAGIKGILTAGHCGNTQQYHYYGSSTWLSTSFRSQARTSTTDVQWHTRPSNVSYPRFHASSTSSTRTLTGRVVRSGQNGDYVCHRGKTTGYSCGTVSTITYRPTWSNACNGVTCSATWIRVSGPSLKCYPGDSGGPWFNSTNAYGIYKGQSSSGTGTAGCNWAVYMAINYISNINVSLLYG
ncbi:S1 family peptidase [Nonomuraea turcica]|uniref:S1 family peptidase n=1 Tax=Nonomuraea sp. G32 TaxID=3067274 RepID=UPI00273C516D|nr:S1 family peptidase [Nonomuraea sp. G32]MDP4505829.1 S1 family peptidase [Nonomuraea sp. G32]